MRSSVVFLAAAVSAVLLTACGQLPVEKTLHVATAAEIDELIPAALAEVHANGIAVAVIDAGQAVYVRSFGRRNDKGEPLREDTVMVAASLTKPVFAAYLAMQLVDEGKIGLDVPIADDLESPLPSYPAELPYPDWSPLSDDKRWRSMTPRMLLVGFAQSTRTWIDCLRRPSRARLLQGGP